MFSYPIGHIGNILFIALRSINNKLEMDFLCFFNYCVIFLLPTTAQSIGCTPHTLTFIYSANFNPPSK